MKTSSDSGKLRCQQRYPMLPLSLTYLRFVTFFKELAGGHMQHLVYVLLKGVQIITIQGCAYGGICVLLTRILSQLFFPRLNWNQDLTENLHFVSFQSLVLLLDQPSK